MPENGCDMTSEVIDAQTMAAEREMLVRFCARYTGAPDAAEDLAQQTLLEAWRHERQLRDPQARKSWLFSIARTTCLMWGRRQCLERSRIADLSDERAESNGPADVFDLEVELDRGALAALLDRALALLPPDTRLALIGRYMEEWPQAEIAARLGLSEGAVEARLHRGKLALRRLLATELSDEAVAHGLLLPERAGWQETRLWCPGCGGRRLEGWMDPEAGRLDLHCPDCAPTPYRNYVHAHMGGGLRDVRMFRPAVSRVLANIHAMFRIRLTDGGLSCPSCGGWMPLRQTAEGVRLSCDRCDWHDWESWHSLTWSLPQVRRFWREHPRMRFLPECEVEAEGIRAVVTGFESLSSSARIEVVAVRESLQVLSVGGEPRTPDLAGHATG